MKKKNCKVAEEIKRLQLQLLQGADIRHLLRDMSKYIDTVIHKHWPSTLGHCSLIATGGYGRQQLHPYSDIDLLLLIPIDDNAATKLIQQFFQALWSLGLKISHSVRTLAQCLSDSKTDLVLYTSLLESRHLAGTDQQDTLLTAIYQHPTWSQKAFLVAKINELETRHEHEADSLEPDIKNYPGGLRDYQHTRWVSLRLQSIEERLEHHLPPRMPLSKNESRTLITAIDWLLTLRFHLHCLVGKAQDRLRFTDQVQLAELYGYQDNANQKAVEQLMQAFYRHTATLKHLSQITNQELSTHFLTSTPTQNEYSSHLKATNNYLSIVPPNAVTATPELLMQAFLILCKHPELRGFNADTIRALLEYTSNTQQWKPNTTCYQLFLDILQCERGIYHQLKNMNNYGVLNCLIPDWQHCCGQMQFDLFHRHTVDQHTMEVLRHARILALNELKISLPHISAIASSLTALRPLYLAILFHDIGKGTGTDHSLWGEKAVYRFARSAQLDKTETDLVAWLVKHHLLMSLTAQKRDINDPEIINQFIQKVNSMEKLDYLYVLTVADIRGTNAKLWSSWVAALLKQLYEQAHAILLGVNTPTADNNNTLSTWPDDYYQRFTSQNIHWHQQSLAQHSKAITWRHHSTHHQCELLIIHPNQPHIFANVTYEIAKQRLNIAEARVYTSNNNHTALLQIIILDSENQPLTDQSIIKELLGHIERALEHKTSPSCLKQINTAKTTVFSNKTNRIDIQSTQNNFTVEIDTLDRPGLVASLCNTFARLELIVHHTKIFTQGERAVDSFELQYRGSGKLSNTDLHYAIEQTLGA